MRENLQGFAVNFKQRDEQLLFINNNYNEFSASLR